MRARDSPCRENRESHRESKEERPPGPRDGRGLVRRKHTPAYAIIVLMNADPPDETSVTVIVPVYNSERYLDACVRSILAQSHRRLQVILVDDGSSDGSGDLCDALASEDPRVVVVHQPNRGIASAQNAGLDLADGDYITFCDNDDLMAPRMIERLVQIAEDAHADISMCRWVNVGASSAGAALLAASGRPSGRVQVFDDPARCYQHIFSLTLRRVTRSELKYFSEANWGKLYRAMLFEGLRFPDGRFAQDVAVAMALYSRATLVASCSDPLYLWLQRGESVSHTLKSTSYYSDIVHAHAASFDLAIQQGITPWRAAYGLGALHDERRSIGTAEDAALFADDRQLVRRLQRRLSIGQRLVCVAVGLLRRAEVVVYDLTVHRRR